MFDHQSCAQAFLKGSPRFHSICGQIRIQCCDGGVVVQLRLRGLPCAGMSQGFLCLRIEGGCGCPCIELAPVPVWQGEAAMTYLMGGFSPDSLIRRVVCLSDPCGGQLADGVFQPCCASPCPPPKPCDPCRPVCPPLKPCDSCRPVCPPKPCDPCRPVCPPKPCDSCRPVCPPKPCAPCRPVCPPTRSREEFFPDLSPGGSIFG